jgi:hypothetical protein
VEPSRGILKAMENIHIVDVKDEDDLRKIDLDLKRDVIFVPANFLLLLDVPIGLDLFAYFAPYLGMLDPTYASQHIVDVFYLKLPYTVIKPQQIVLVSTEEELEEIEEVQIDTRLQEFFSQLIGIIPIDYSDIFDDFCNRIMIQKNDIIKYKLEINSEGSNIIRLFGKEDLEGNFKNLKLRARKYDYTLEPDENYQTYNVIKLKQANIHIPLNP